MKEWEYSYVEKENKQGNKAWDSESWWRDDPWKEYIILVWWEGRRNLELTLELYGSTYMQI